MHEAKKHVLTIKGQNYKSEEMVKQLIYIPADNIVAFFQDIALNIPRQLRIDALRAVLEGPALKTREERKALADEMGYRLSYFSRYTETQLINLLEFYKDNNLRREYFIKLWELLLLYIIDKKVAENDLARLVLEAERYATQKDREIPSSLKYNNTINPLFYDEEGKIDGLTPEEFRPVTYKSSTLTELRSIGDKYNAPVPKRLRKKEVQEIILNELSDRGELTEELREEVLSKNVIILERFARDHDIKVSTELRKEEIIEYILSNAKETKEMYYEPQDSTAYEIEEDEVVEVLEEVVELPLEEEIKEEVVEEVVVTPQQVVYQHSPHDYTPVLTSVVEELKSIKEVVGSQPAVQVNNAASQNQREILKYELLKDEPNDIMGGQSSMNHEAGQGVVINNNITIDGGHPIMGGKRGKPKTKVGRFFRGFFKTLKWLIILLIIYLLTLFVLSGVNVFAPNGTIQNILDVLNRGVSWLDLGGAHLGEHFVAFFTWIQGMLS